MRDKFWILAFHNLDKNLHMSMHFARKSPILEDAAGREKSQGKDLMG